MDDPNTAAMELLTGRWRSQILHAGVKLGILDTVAAGKTLATDTSSHLSLHPGNTYRLMRALASIGILSEDDANRFSLTEVGRLFTADHPHSLRGVCLWEEGDLMCTVWRHMPDIVRDGEVDGFHREFDQPAFAYISSHPDVAALFNDAMTSYSRMETGLILTALAEEDFSGVSHVCDIAGGQGMLLCQLLQKHPHLRGTVLELPSTLENPDNLLAPKMGVDARCDYVAADMFNEIPPADAYFLKYILHDWNDADSARILSAAHEASAGDARLFIAENIVPGPEQADFSKLMDIHMMTVLHGRERTEGEYAALMAESGWRHVKTWRQGESTLAVVEARKS